MKSARTDSFWPSYTDLMTSLFFVMLVLFILVFARQHQTITGPAAEAGDHQCGRGDVGNPF